MGPGMYPPGNVAVMKECLRKEMDNLTGGPSAQAAMRQQIRDNAKDTCPGAPPAGPAWYNKP